MKTHFFIAMILAASALPAAAQTAPSAEHQAHAEHGQMEHGQMDHGQMDHGQDDPSTAPAAGHEDHQGHVMEAGCCADSDGDGRMDCCENMAEGSSCCPSSEQQAEQEGDEHQGHAE